MPGDPRSLQSWYACTTECAATLTHRHALHRYGHDGSRPDTHDRPDTTISAFFLINTPPKPSYTKGRPVPWSVNPLQKLHCSASVLSTQSAVDSAALCRHWPALAVLNTNIFTSAPFDLEDERDQRGRKDDGSRALTAGGCCRWRIRSRRRAAGRSRGRKGRGPPACCTRSACCATPSWVFCTATRRCGGRSPTFTRHAGTRSGTLSRRPLRQRLSPPPERTQWLLGCTAELPCMRRSCLPASLRSAGRVWRIQRPVAAVCCMISLDVHARALLFPYPDAHPTRRPLPQGFSVIYHVSRVLSNCHRLRLIPAP